MRKLYLVRLSAGGCGGVFDAPVPPEPGAPLRSNGPSPRFPGIFVNLNPKFPR